MKPAISILQITAPMLVSQMHTRSGPIAEATCFGSCPARDAFVLVQCGECGVLLKPVALAHHAASRHPRATRRLALPEDVENSYLLSPPLPPCQPCASTAREPAPDDGNIFDQLKSKPSPGGLRKAPQRRPNGAHRKAVKSLRREGSVPAAAPARTKKGAGEDSNSSSESNAYVVRQTAPNGQLRLTFRKADVEAPPLHPSPSAPSALHSLPSAAKVRAVFPRNLTVLDGGCLGGRSEKPAKTRDSVLAPGELTRRAPAQVQYAGGQRDALPSPTHCLPSQYPAS